MKKVIRNGQVAILYSPGYGAGWYTWNRDYPQLMFHPQLIEWTEKGLPEEIDLEEWLQKEFELPEDDSIYIGGWPVSIAWLPEGTTFRINEYDGSESIEVLDIESNYFTA